MTTSKLIPIFDYVLYWDNTDKVEFLARLMGTLQAYEQIEKLPESLITSILQQYNIVKPERYITTTCQYCGSNYKVDKNIFDIYCPYCGNK